MLVLAAAGVFVVGVAAMAAGAPMTPVVLLVAAIDVALLLRASGERKFGRAEQVAPGALDAYPLKFPVQRWAVGAPWQFRFAPASRRVWAAGVLGVGYGEARFVPTSGRSAGAGWVGRPTSVEVLKTMQVCAVRFRAPEGDAQFSIQMPAAQVRAHLDPMLPVAEA